MNCLWKLDRSVANVIACALTFTITALGASACGDPFSSCEAHRSCPEPTGGNGGGGGAASGGSGGDTNTGGTLSADGGSAGTPSSSGDGGEVEAGRGGDSNSGASAGDSSEGGGSNAGAGGAGGDDASGNGSRGGASSGAAAGEGSIGGVWSGGVGSGGTSSGGSSSGGKSSGGASSGGVGTGTGGAPSNGCTSNPCLNGATCTPGSGSSYSCACSNRFVGSRCEFQRFLPISIWPAAVSADGTVVVGQACDGLGDNLNCPPAKVGSTGGTPTALSLPAAVDQELRAGCEVQAVNGDGSWIGAGCIHASVEWKSSNSGAFVAGRNSGEVVSDLVDASLDGTIVLGRLHFTELGTDTAFRRVPTTGIVPVAVDPNDQTAMVPNGISNDGLVVVGIGDGYALRWDPRNGTERLPKFDGDDSFYDALDVSGDGTVIVGYRAQSAIRWPSPTVVQSLGEGVARAVSNQGTITVGRSIATATALAWDAAGTRKTVLELVGSTPDVAGWTLKEAVGVSDDGKVIVGRGTNPSQQSQGWVVRLP